MADFSSPLLLKPSQNALEMDGLKKTFPSLPSNYVTLQQLQERRLKEKEENEEEERRKHQKEKEENDVEERRKRLVLQKSRKTLETKASDRPGRRHIEYRPKIIERRDEISVVEKEVDDQNKNIKESRKKVWKDKRKPKKSGTQTVADPAEPRPGNGQEEEDRNRKIGTGFRTSREDAPENIESKNMEDRAVEIARKNGDLSERKADERSTPKRKRYSKQSRRKILSTEEKLPEKIESKDGEDRTVEITQKIRDLSVVDCDNTVETDGRKEADKTAEKNHFQRLRRMNWSTSEYLPKKIEKKDEKDRTVEIAQKKGDAAVVDCDQTVEETDSRKEPAERSIAEKKHDIRRLRERIPGIRPWKSEKQRMDRTVEIEQKVEGLRVVDCDEIVETVGGKEVGDRSTAEKKTNESRPLKSEKHRMDRTVEIALKIGELSVVDCDEDVDPVAGGKEVGERSTAEKKIPETRPWKNEKHRVNCRRGFRYRGERKPSDLVWVRKEEVSNDLYSSSSRSASILRPEYKESFQFTHIGGKAKQWQMHEQRYNPIL